MKWLVGCDGGSYEKTEPPSPYVISEELNLRLKISQWAESEEVTAFDLMPRRDLGLDNLLA